MDNNQKTIPINNKTIGINRKIKIQIDIALKGINQKILADKLNVSTSMLNRVISGKRKSKKIAQQLCDELNYNIEIIFPEYQGDRQ